MLGYIRKKQSSANKQTIAKLVDKIPREQQTIPEENQVQISKNKIIKDRNNSRKLHFQSFLNYEFLLRRINFL